MREQRTCIVCGAKVTNINPKARTCDSICTRARNYNRTRAAQIEAEMKKPMVTEIKPYVFHDEYDYDQKRIVHTYE